MRKWLRQSAFRQLLPHISPYKWWLLLIFFLLLLIAFLTTLPPWLIQHGIDTVMPAGNMTWLLWLGAGVLLLSLAEGSLSFVQQILSEWISQRMIHDIRNQLFHHLNQLSFSFFDRTRVGDLIARIVADTDVLKRFVGFGLLKVVTNVLVLIWILISLTLWSPWMGLLFLLMLPFMVHAMWAYSTQVRPALRRTRATTGELTSFTREHLAGIAVIKLFGNESSVESSFNRENSRILADTLAATRISAFWLPYSEVLLGFFAGLVLLSGGWMITTGRVTAGSLVGFLAYVNLLNRPIRQTGFLLNLFQQGDVAAQRIVELLAQEESLRDAPGAVPFVHLSRSIRMESVSFSYHEQPVVADVSFALEKGETLAIVGPSGAGKTTLVHLLLRFYDPQKGQVLIDEKPIQQYTIQSLRQKMGLVMQQPFLFNGNIGENISLGSPHVSEAAIRQAAERSQLHSFIEGLPLKYRTPIGERGVRLSGGQAQRLALARVLLREPEVLVLDEPTSSVDHLTDASIMDAVSELMSDKTLLVIAHRLATLRNAGRILFLENGHITGMGTHDDLMSRNKQYRYFVQASGYARDDGSE